LDKQPKPLWLGLVRVSSTKHQYNSDSLAVQVTVTSTLCKIQLAEKVQGFGCSGIRWHSCYITCLPESWTSSNVTDMYYLNTDMVFVWPFCWGRLLCFVWRGRKRGICCRL